MSASWGSAESTKKEQEHLLFSVQLRRASRKTHSISDALVNARLISILTDPKLYARALGCFYYIFEAIERGLEVAQKLDSSAFCGPTTRTDVLGLMRHCLAITKTTELNIMFVQGLMHSMKRRNPCTEAKQFR